MNTPPPLRRLCCAALALLAPIAAADYRDDIGYNQLRTEYPNLPTGLNLTVLQIEYGSNPTGSDWATSVGGQTAGKTITYLPAGTVPTSFSTHADGVAANLVGATYSVIPDTPRLVSSGSSAYMNTTLSFRQGAAPITPTWDLESHTWGTNSASTAIELLRRIDWRVDNQGVTVVSALPNDSNPVFSAPACSYNGITVGVTDGSHLVAGTLLEGLGRIKPDIVAPFDWTSNATPTIAACSGLLIEQAKIDTRFSAARDPRVVRALLLAGATKAETPGWTNSPTQPLDTRFGAGQVNIAHSYRMLVAGRQSAGNTLLSQMGWDTATSGGGRYFLEVPVGQVATLSAVLAWNRTITPDATWTVLTPSLADLNLRLSSATAGFAVGTVVAESRSTIDNVEHIYRTTLSPGRYVLEITGPAGTTYGIAWRSILTPHPEPVISTPPTAQSAASGASAFFSIDASGVPTPTYQWQRLAAGGTTWTDLADGSGYSGTRTNSLRVNGVSAAMSGDQFRCMATNSGGTTTSTAAALTVTASTALLQRPTGLALDSSGNLVVSDPVQNTIKRITSAGAVSTFAGTIGVAGSQNGTGSAASFNQPNGTAVDASGNVLVADTSNATVRRITSAGVVSTLAGSAASRGSADGTGSAASFNAPDGIAVDGTGNAYIADTFNHTLRRVTSAGVVTTVAGTAGSSGETDGTGTAARFNNPKAVAVDSSGNVFVADTFNHTIRRLATDGTVTTLAGSAGIAGTFDGTGRNALFNQPAGITVDSAGNLYISDTGNCTIRRIAPGGVVTTVAGMAGIAGWGNAIGTDALFNQPRGIVVATGGILFVADTGNGEIRRIAADGNVTTLALSAAPVPPPPVTPTTTIPPSPPTGGGSSGGGGALMPWFLLTLVALTFVRILARQRNAEPVI